MPASLGTTKLQLRLRAQLCRDSTLRQPPGIRGWQRRCFPKLPVRSLLGNSSLEVQEPKQPTLHQILPKSLCIASPPLNITSSCVKPLLPNMNWAADPWCYKTAAHSPYKCSARRVKHLAPDRRSPVRAGPRRSEPSFRVPNAGFRVPLLSIRALQNPETPFHGPEAGKRRSEAQSRAPEPGRRGSERRFHGLEGGMNSPVGRMTGPGGGMNGPGGGIRKRE